MRFRVSSAARLHFSLIPDVKGGRQTRHLVGGKPYQHGVPGDRGGAGVWANLSGRLEPEWTVS